MVRKQILITPEQSRRLKARARALHCHESEVIRAAIDREVGAVEADNDWKRRLLELAGALNKREASDLDVAVQENRARWQKRVNELGRKLRGDD